MEVKTERFIRAMKEEKEMLLKKKKNTRMKKNSKSL